MPIPVTCRCGKQMKVPEQYAGKRIKCPKCGAPTAVPDAASVGKASAESPGTVQVPPPPPPGMVRFHCSCGKQMQAKIEYAGRSTRCPACNATLPIPAESEAPPPSPATSRPPSSEPALDATVHDTTAPPTESATGTTRRRGRRTRQTGPLLSPLFRKAALVIVGLMLLGGLAAAGWWWLASGLPADLALVPADAQAMVSIRLADAWDSGPVQAALASNAKGRADLDAGLEKEFGITAGDIERISLLAPDLSKPQSWLVIAGRKPLDRAKLAGRLEGGSKNVKAGERSYQVSAKAAAGTEPLAVWFVNDRVVVLASEPALKAILALDPAERPTGALADMIHQLAGGGALAAAWTPPPVEGTSLEAPGAAEPAKAMLEALVNRLSAELTEAPLERKKLLARVDAAIKDLAVARGDGTKANRITPFEPEQVAANAIKPALATLQSAASAGAGQDNLKQIADAFKAYHAAKGRFPAAAVVKNDKPLFSWRVELLPHLGEQALYDEFKKDEPHDSPANKALWSKMPKVYALPGKPGDTDKTYYQVFVGPGALFKDIGTSPKLADISRLPSKTILAVESAKPVVWCAPTDLPFPAGDGIDPKQLGGHFGDIFHAIMADGSTLAIKRNVTPKSLRIALMPASRDRLGDDWEAATKP